MAELAPGAPATLPVQSNLAGLPLSQRLKAFTAQPAVRRSLPALIGLSGLAIAAVLWSVLSEPPQRILYASLSDAERAEVVDSLDGAGIPYSIDAGSGTLNVSEADVYKARMTVASTGVLTPDAGADLLDTIPLGSSRMLESERLRMARERELILTILEIDGVEAARVHLAMPERSSFVREQAAPSASVMVRLGRGRSLSPEQVQAVTSLVAAAVPGMLQDNVRLTNQHGQLLTSTSAFAQSVNTQDAVEKKLRAQIAQLLLPVLGDGNFTAEVQVELSHSETTRAEESYDKQGVLRSIDEAASQQTGETAANGVPGVLSNMPQPAVQLGQPPAADVQRGQVLPASTESTIRRDYELGRQISVSSEAAGSLRRLSVAVVVDTEALRKARPITLEQIELLTAAAVGAQTDQGDDVVAIVSSLRKDVVSPLPFYDKPAFAKLVWNSVTCFLLLTAIFILLKYLRTVTGRSPPMDQAHNDDPELKQLGEAWDGRQLAPPSGKPLNERIRLVHEIIEQHPEDAVRSIKQLLKKSAE